MYISVKQAAEKWGISDRRVRILCSEGKIPGVIREGRSYRIPEAAKKPEDGRYRSAESLLEMIDRKKAELDTRRPLTEGEVERFTEEFAVEYTYNSNAIEGNTLTLRKQIWCCVVSRLIKNLSKTIWRRSDIKKLFTLCGIW